MLDLRNNELSAMVRNRQFRIKAWNKYNKENKDTNELENYFQMRRDNEYKNIMNSLPKSWQEFQTYKKLFEILSPFFIFKKRSSPQSFYLKYCKK